MNREKLEQINLKPKCQHPKGNQEIYCECNREFYIAGHICGLCLKILDLRINRRNKETQLPKIDRALFD